MTGEPLHGTSWITWAPQQVTWPIGALETRVILEKVRVVGIGHRRHVHAFVSQAQTMDAVGDFRRSEMFHMVTLASIHAVLIPAACMTARLTAVFASCTL